AHVLAASRGDGRGASGGGGEGRAPRPLPGVARLVSWRGWFGCASRMRPLALSGLRVVARVSEAHPGSPLPLGERTCSRATGAHVVECRFPRKWPGRGRGGGEGRAPRPWPA